MLIEPVPFDRPYILGRTPIVQGLDSWERGASTPVGCDDYSIGGVLCVVPLYAVYISYLLLRVGRAKTQNYSALMLIQQTQSRRI